MATIDLPVLAFNDELLEQIAATDLRDFITLWICVAAVWFIVTILFTRTGWTETKVAKGSVWRLIWIAGVLAGIVELPGIVYAGYLIFSTASSEQFWIAVAAAGSGILFTNLYLQPPVRISDSKQQLPLLTDEKLLGRIAELARQMNVAVPVVRLLSSMGPQQAQAFAGTIQAPQLLLADGILHRLEATERDAIIAHELGHIANGSLWLYVLIYPVCGAITVAAAALLPTQVALAFGLALFVGLKRIISRPTELDCDRRAARVVGFRATSTALAKIHAVHPLKNAGLLPQLVYATASHPSPDARRAALFDAAPADDRPDPIANSAAVRLSGRLAYLALLIWAIVLLVVLAIGFRGTATNALVVPLLGTALAPLALALLALRKQMALARRQSQLHRGPRAKWFMRIGLTAFALTFASIPILFAMGMKDAVGIPATLLSVTTIGWFVVRSSQSDRPQRLLEKVAFAMQMRNFQRALELCAGHPKIVADSHLLRYHQAICHEVSGDRETAISVLEQLWIDKPLFPLAALALAELLLDSNQPERAIKFVHGVAPLLPQDPIVPLLEGRILRRWGKFDEAQTACDQALALEPDNGCIVALAAGLELDRGHLEVARSLLHKALELAPGEPYLLVVKAEIDLASESLDQGESSADRAAELVQSNPFSFLRVEVARLKELLARKKEGTDNPQIATVPINAELPSQNVPSPSSE